MFGWVSRNGPLQNPIAPFFLAGCISAAACVAAMLGHMAAPQADVFAIENIYKTWLNYKFVAVPICKYSPNMNSYQNHMTSTVDVVGPVWPKWCVSLAWPGFCYRLGFGTDIETAEAMRARRLGLKRESTWKSRGGRSSQLSQPWFCCWLQTAGVSQRNERRYRYTMVYLKNSFTKNRAQLLDIAMEKRHMWSQGPAQKIW